LFSPVPVYIGIGFAVPSISAYSVLAQILAHGGVRRGRLGVTPQDLTTDVAGVLSPRAVHGALVVNVVPGTPADKAGLRRNDVVIAVDGSPIRGPAPMRSLVGLVRLGSNFTPSVLRGSEFLSMEVRLTEPATQPADAVPRTDPNGRETES